MAKMYAPGDSALDGLDGVLFNGRDPQRHRRADLARRLAAARAHEDAHMRAMLDPGDYARYRYPLIGQKTFGY